VQLKVKQALITLPAHLKVSPTAQKLKCARISREVTDFPTKFGFNALKEDARTVSEAPPSSYFKRGR